MKASQIPSEKKRPPPCEFWDPLILAVKDASCCYQRSDDEGTGDKKAKLPRDQRACDWNPKYRLPDPRVSTHDPYVTHPL